MKTINSFTDEFHFLSNFQSCIVEFDGKSYPSVEHAYQASKTIDDEERLYVSHCVTAGRAKRMGSKVKLRSGWEDIKLNVMENLLRKKFSISGFKQLLLDTENTELIEGNNWNDTFWGICNGVGTNHLGKLLMKIRLEIKNC